MGTFEQHWQVVVLYKDIHHTVVSPFRTKKHETGQNIRKGDMFYCVLRSLSSCDHLDLEKSPSVRETNGTATGSRYIGRSKNLQSIGSKLQQISTLLCITGLRLESDNTLDPLSFSLFKKKKSFLSIQVNGIRKGLPGGYDTMSSSVLTGDSSVFTRLFPVSCLVRWGIVLHFLSELCLCHQATLLVAHWPNSAAPAGPALLLLQFTMLVFLPWRLLVLFLLLKHCICEWK